jgi:hypothetical protein
MKIKGTTLLCSHAMSSLTIHFIQNEFIRGNIQLPKLQWLLEPRTTPLEKNRLIKKGYRERRENKI